MTVQIFADYVPDEEPPTLTIEITRDFEADPRRKRETICQPLATLATGFDGRVVARAVGATTGWPTLIARTSPV